MSRTKEHYIALITILKKEIYRFMRLWIQTILPPAITAVLYFLIFGSLIGKQITDMQGHSYVQFIAPGLIMMSVITSTYGNVSSSFFMAKFQRSIEEILVSPTPNYIMLLGYVGGGIARGFTIGIIVSLVTLFFTHLRMEHVWLMLLIITLTSALFSLAGFINALFANKFDDISIIPTFVLTPLTYLGGVFYSIYLLPTFWQKLSLLNPILYIVNAFRYSMLGSSDIHIDVGVVVIFGFVALMFWFCLFLLNRGYGIKT